jgi:hypothetical protein
MSDELFPSERFMNVRYQGIELYGWRLVAFDPWCVPSSSLYPSTRRVGLTRSCTRSDRDDVIPPFLIYRL